MVWCESENENRIAEMLATKPGEGGNQMTNDNYKNREEICSRPHNLGQKLLFFMIGGGIGAALALLLAPKSGTELRGDIADMAVKGYDETMAAANRLKTRSAEVYAVAKETGDEVLDVVTAGASVIKGEVTKDVEKIGAIVEDSARRAIGSAN
jgi:gas vesicle protein